MTTQRELPERFIVVVGKTIEVIADPNGTTVEALCVDSPHVARALGLDPNRVLYLANPEHQEYLEAECQRKERLREMDAEAERRWQEWNTGGGKDRGEPELLRPGYICYGPYF